MKRIFFLLAATLQLALSAVIKSVPITSADGSDCDPVSVCAPRFPNSPNVWDAVAMFVLSSNASQKALLATDDTFIKISDVGGCHVPEDYATINHPTVPLVNMTRVFGDDAAQCMNYAKVHDYRSFGFAQGDSCTFYRERALGAGNLAPGLPQICYSLVNIISITRPREMHTPDVWQHVASNNKRVSKPLYHVGVDELFNGIAHEVMSAFFVSNNSSPASVSNHLRVCSADLYDRPDDGTTATCTGTTGVADSPGMYGEKEAQMVWVRGISPVGEIVVLATTSYACQPGTQVPVAPEVIMADLHIPPTIFPQSVGSFRMEFPHVDELSLSPTVFPTRAPTTPAPSSSPTTAAPSTSPTSPPTVPAPPTSSTPSTVASPTTAAPSTSPTSPPTVPAPPTISAPSPVASPTTLVPSKSPTSSPVASPTKEMALYVMEGKDSYGDGWNGNAVDILADGHVVVSGFTVPDGNVNTQGFQAASDANITLSWTVGEYTNEVSWILRSAPPGGALSKIGSGYQHHTNAMKDQQTKNPTSAPTGKPSAIPTGDPTSAPTGKPSGHPTGNPTSVPTGNPSAIPTGKPSAIPTGNPTSLPTGNPTSLPTGNPSIMPTGNPTSAPTPGPTGSPTPGPTVNPTPGPTDTPPYELFGAEPSSCCVLKSGVPAYKTPSDCTNWEEVGDRDAGITMADCQQQCVTRGSNDCAANTFVHGSDGCYIIGPADGSSVPECNGLPGTLIEVPVGTSLKTYRYGPDPTPPALPELMKATTGGLVCCDPLQLHETPTWGESKEDLPHYYHSTFFSESKKLAEITHAYEMKLQELSSTVNSHMKENSPAQSCPTGYEGYTSVSKNFDFAGSKKETDFLLTYAGLCIHKDATQLKELFERFILTTEDPFETFSARSLGLISNIFSPDFLVMQLLDDEWLYGDDGSQDSGIEVNAEVNQDTEFISKKKWEIMSAIVSTDVPQFTYFWDAVAYLANETRIAASAPVTPDGYGQDVLGLLGIDPTLASDMCKQICVSPLPHVEVASNYNRMVGSIETMCNQKMKCMETTPQHFDAIGAKMNTTVANILVSRDSEISWQAQSGFDVISSAHCDNHQKSKIENTSECHNYAKQYNASVFAYNSGTQTCMVAEKATGIAGSNGVCGPYSTQVHASGWQMYRSPSTAARDKKRAKYAETKAMVEDHCGIPNNITLHRCRSPGTGTGRRRRRDTHNLFDTVHELCPLTDALYGKGGTSSGYPLSTTGYMCLKEQVSTAAVKASAAACASCINNLQGGRDCYECEVVDGNGHLVVPTECSNGNSTECAAFLRAHDLKYEQRSRAQIASFCFTDEGKDDPSKPCMFVCPVSFEALGSTLKACTAEYAGGSTGCGFATYKSASQGLPADCMFSRTPPNVYTFVGDDTETNVGWEGTSVQLRQGENVLVADFTVIKGSNSVDFPVDVVPVDGGAEIQMHWSHDDDNYDYSPANVNWEIRKNEDHGGHNYVVIAASTECLSVAHIPWQPGLPILHYEFVAAGPTPEANWGVNVQVVINVDGEGRGLYGGPVQGPNIFVPIAPAEKLTLEWFAPAGANTDNVHWEIRRVEDGNVVASGVYGTEVGIIAPGTRPGGPILEIDGTDTTLHELEDFDRTDSSALIGSKFRLSFRQRCPYVAECVRKQMDADPHYDGIINIWHNDTSCTNRANCADACGCELVGGKCQSGRVGGYDSTCGNFEDYSDTAASMALAVKYLTALPTILGACQAEIRSGYWEHVTGSASTAPQFTFEECLGSDMYNDIYRDESVPSCPDISHFCPNAANHFYLLPPPIVADELKFSAMSHSCVLDGAPEDLRSFAMRFNISASAAAPDDCAAICSQLISDDPTSQAQQLECSKFALFEMDGQHSCVSYHLLANEHQCETDTAYWKLTGQWLPSDEKLTVYEQVFDNEDLVAQSPPVSFDRQPMSCFLEGEPEDLQAFASAFNIKADAAQPGQPDPPAPTSASDCAHICNNIITDNERMRLPQQVECSTWAFHDVGGNYSCVSYYQLANEQLCVRDTTDYWKLTGYWRPSNTTLAVYTKEAEPGTLSGAAPAPCDSLKIEVDKYNTTTNVSELVSTTCAAERQKLMDDGLDFKAAFKDLHVVQKTCCEAGEAGSSVDAARFNAFIAQMDKNMAHRDAYKAQKDALAALDACGKTGAGNYTELGAVLDAIITQGAEVADYEQNVTAAIMKSYYRSFETEQVWQTALDEPDNESAQETYHTLVKSAMSDLKDTRDLEDGPLALYREAFAAFETHRKTALVEVEETFPNSTYTFTGYDAFGDDWDANSGQTISVFVDDKEVRAGFYVSPTGSYSPYGGNEPSTTSFVFESNPAKTIRVAWAGIGGRYHDEISWDITVAGCKITKGVYPTCSSYINGFYRNEEYATQYYEFEALGSASRRWDPVLQTWSPVPSWENWEKGPITAKLSVNNETVLSINATGTYAFDATVGDHVHLQWVGGSSFLNDTDNNTYPDAIEYLIGEDYNLLKIASSDADRDKIPNYIDADFREDPLSAIDSTGNGIIDQYEGTMIPSHGAAQADITGDGIVELGHAPFRITMPRCHSYQGSYGFQVSGDFGSKIDRRARAVTPRAKRLRARKTVLPGRSRRQDIGSSALGQTYVYVGPGVADGRYSDEVWGVDPKGNGFGHMSCFLAVIQDSRCTKDYFSYVERSDGNCGCKGQPRAGVRMTGKAAGSDYYQIEQNTSVGSQSYEYVGTGVANVEHGSNSTARGELWDVDPKGNGAGNLSCFQAVMRDSRCTKDYFSYVERGDQNCGCIMDPLQVREIGTALKSNYYQITQDTKVQDKEACIVESRDTLLKVQHDECTSYLTNYRCGFGSPDNLVTDDTGPLVGSFGGPSPKQTVGCSNAAGTDNLVSMRALCMHACPTTFDKWVKSSHSWQADFLGNASRFDDPMSPQFINATMKKADQARSDCAAEIAARAVGGTIDSASKEATRRGRSLLSVKALATEKRGRRHADTPTASTPTSTTATATHTHTTTTSYDYFADHVERLAAALASGAQTNITFSNGDQQYASCNEVCADQSIQATRVRVRTMVVTSNPQSAQCANPNTPNVAGTRGTMGAIYGATFSVTLLVGGVSGAI